MVSIVVVFAGCSVKGLSFGSNKATTEKEITMENVAIVVITQ